jgi:putative transcriptional regulator
MDNGEGRLFYAPPGGRSNDTMPIVYKIDILAALKEKGYNTNRLRKEKLLAEGVIQSLRENKYIALQNISKICGLLECQPADLMEYVKGEEN